MISRLIVRTVLVSIITALAGALWGTWTVNFQNISQPVALMIVESSVLLAALSLLFESFLSFGTISVERRSWKYFLSGLYILDEDRKSPSINTRTCELFGVRSVVLSVFSIMAAICVTFLYQILKTAALFLLKPSLLPAVNWGEKLQFVGLWVAVLPIAMLLNMVQMSIDKKIANKALSIVVSVFYWSAVFGIAMGVVSILIDPNAFQNTSVFLLMLIGTGVGLGMASLIGAIFGLAYALYKFVGRMSQRFPVLENVWNQLCPVQTVRFQ